MSIKPTRVSKKTGTKIYGRTERDRRNEPDTATPMTGKQHIIRQEKAALSTIQTKSQ